MKPTTDDPQFKAFTNFFIQGFMPFYKRYRKIHPEVTSIDFPPESILGAFYLSKWGRKFLKNNMDIKGDLKETCEDLC
jgi:hypothetical protein